MTKMMKMRMRQDVVEPVVVNLVLVKSGEQFHDRQKVNLLLPRRCLQLSVSSIHHKKWTEYESYPKERILFCSKEV